MGLFRNPRDHWALRSTGLFVFLFLLFAFGQVFRMIASWGHREKKVDPKERFSWFRFAAGFLRPSKRRDE